MFTQIFTDDFLFGDKSYTNSKVKFIAIGRQL